VTFHAGYSPAEHDVSTRLASGFGKRFADLTEAAARIEESSGAGRLETRYRREELAQQLAERSCGNSPARLDRGELGRFGAPDLACVRKVEVAADRFAQAPLKYRRETLGGFRRSGPTIAAAHHVTQSSERESRIQAQQKIYRFERKVNPASTQPDAAMPRTIEQIAA